MARKRFTPEQIINHLREAEILVNQGQTVAEACRQISVSEQTYYRWRREYGGLEIEQIRRPRKLLIPARSGSDCMPGITT